MIRLRCQQRVYLVSRKQTTTRMKSIIPFLLASFHSPEAAQKDNRPGVITSLVTNMAETETIPKFVGRYLNRIGLDPLIRTVNATTPLDYDFLCQLTEAHLSNIPFENLAQHGGYGGPVELSLETIEKKILDRRRGGFCLELNGLFASLLEQLGAQVVIVPAVVYVDRSIGFDRPATHIILIVTLPNRDDEESRTYFVDVGFGEPPNNPLKYEFGIEQITSEGMKSRLIESNGHVTLEWFKDDEWKPRLRWTLNDSLAQSSPSIDCYQHILDMVYNETSNFSNKLIVCRLTREKKLTLAGSKFKETGPPRFMDNQQGVVKSTPVESLQQARDILAEHFGIPLDETAHLDWARISSQDPQLFAQM